MLLEETGKFADMQMRLKRILTGVYIVCLLFVVLGCKQSVPITADIPTPTVSPPAIVTMAPPQSNPIGSFWNSFYSLYASSQAILDESVTDEAHVAQLGDVIALRQLMQRLQHLFLAASDLPPGSSEDTWEGELLGTFEGRGSVYGNDAGCTFSCTFSDGSKVTGQLENGRLKGEWRNADQVILGEDGEETQMEGAVRANAEISMLEGGCHVSLRWEGEYCALRILGNTIWFSKNTQTWIDANIPPEHWAAWCYEDGAYVSYAQQLEEKEGEFE